MQRISLRVDVRRKLSVGHARANCDRTGLLVQSHRVELLQRDLIETVVGDVVKGVARAESLQGATVLHRRLHLFCCLAER